MRNQSLIFSARNLAFLLGLLVILQPLVLAQDPGEVDLSFDAGSSIDGRVLATAQQSDGKWVIAGDFTTVNDAVRRHVARLNPDGSTDHSFGADRTGPNDWVETVALQEDGRIVIGGRFSEVDGQPRNRLARLNADGTLDRTFGEGLTGANGFVAHVALQGDGRVLIAGNFTAVHGQPRNRIARLNEDGALDSTFAAGTAGANDWVQAIAIQPDGKILIGGWFTAVNGEFRNRIARLNSDGSLDSDFGQGESGANHWIQALAVQPDGKVIVGGWFTSLNGAMRNRIARLHPDGTVDSSFGLGLAGANGAVDSISIRSDGEILIGGGFTYVNGLARNRVARLNADGTLDRNFGEGLSGADLWVNVVAVQEGGRVFIGGHFEEVNGEPRKGVASLNPDGIADETFRNGPVGPNSLVLATAVQDDGKILVGGLFTMVREVPRNRLARLNPDGTVDRTFGNGLAGANDGVSSIVLQSDGKILIGGVFTTVNGEARNGVARLNGDGTLDSAFGAGLAGANSAVESIVLQSDGKILIGGGFTAVNGEPRHRIARLNPDGTLDASFGNGLAGADFWVESVAVQDDGKILLGGWFSTVNGEPRDGLARLNPDGMLDTAFAPELSGEDVLVAHLAVQSDGKVLIIGDFTAVNGEPRGGIARLNADGSLDSGFEVSLSGGFGEVLALQEDGSILIAGAFTAVNGEPRGRIARLHEDGTLDSGFGAGLAGANSAINSISLQADGEILVSGWFTAVNDIARERLARLHGGAPEPPGSFEEWAESLPAGERGETDDPGGHGIPNLLRYAFGMDPLEPERERLPQIAMDQITEGGELKTRLVLTYNRRKDDPGLSYLVQVSSDLVQWAPLPGDEQTGDDGGETETITITDPDPIENNRKRFLRVQVETL